MFADIQRFQVHYTLKEIPEIQDFLRDAFEKSEHHGDLQDLYRRRYGCPVVRQSNLLKVYFLVCLSSLDKLRMPHLQGMCANFSPGQIVLMLVILYKSHDSSDITSCRVLSPSSVAPFRCFSFHHLHFLI
jgi:hypothetical protein